MKNTFDTIREAYEAVHSVDQELTRFWLKEILWSWKWWVELGLAVIPWILWFLYRKKRSSNRLLFAGFAVMLIASWLDFEGISLGLWAYDTALIPSIPTFIPWDFSLIPVTAMFALQIKPQLNPFVKMVLISAGTSYIGEPFFKWIELYDPKDWKYSYSFVIYIVIFLFAHYLSRRGSFEKL